MYVHALLCSAVFGYWFASPHHLVRAVSFEYQAKLRSVKDGNAGQNAETSGTIAVKENSYEVGHLLLLDARGAVMRIPRTNSRHDKLTDCSSGRELTTFMLKVVTMTYHRIHQSPA